MHISGTFEIPLKANIENQKVSIGEQKANIEEQKANIESSFSAKTASHICRLLEEFGYRTIFGRSDVQGVLHLKPTRSTELLKEMSQKGFVEPVGGFGKGKYRFRNKLMEDAK